MSSHARTAASDSNRRKKYLINPSFQWKYALGTAVAVFLITSILSSVLYGILHHQARMRVMYPETYTAEVPMIIMLFGVAFAGISAVGMGIWSVLVTHRFCGPLHVMQQYFQTMAQGHFPQPRALRRKDEFKPFYAAFGQAVEAIREGRTLDLQTIAEALRVADAAMAAGDAERKQALQTVIGQLHGMRDAAQNALDPDADQAQQRKPATDEVAAGSPALT